MKKMVFALLNPSFEIFCYGFSLYNLSLERECVSGGSVVQDKTTKVKTKKCYYHICNLK